MLVQDLLPPLRFPYPNEILLGQRCPDGYYLHTPGTPKALSGKMGETGLILEVGLHPVGMLPRWAPG